MSDEPATPSPASSTYRRRVDVLPSPGRVVAEMEDHHHHFRCELALAGGTITEVRVTGVRAPWTTCGVGADATSALVGLTVDEASDPQSWCADRAAHCIHVTDLALIAVRHARDDEPLAREVCIRPAARHHRTVTLTRNGAPAMRWELEGHTIAGPDPFDHLELARDTFLPWIRQHLTTDEVEDATIMRRASSIAYGNAFDLDSYEFAGDVHPPDESCHTYRADIAFTARRSKGTSRALFWDP